MFGLVDHTSYVLPLPRYEVSVECGHIDLKVSKCSHLVIHRTKTPDTHVDVVVPTRPMAATAFGSGTAVGAVLKISYVIMKSG